MNARLKIVDNSNPDALLVSFDDFWSLWPRRLAKKDALKAWLRVRPVDHQKILRAVEAAKQTEQWQKDDGQFIPYPASWLNGERWDDELGVAMEAEQCAWNRNGNRGHEGRCTKNAAGAKNGQPYCKAHLEAI